MARKQRNRCAVTTVASQDFEGWIRENACLFSGLTSSQRLQCFAYRAEDAFELCIRGIEYG